MTALVGRSLLALFARQRELAADRAAVELARSAAALAAALQKVDAEAVDAPTTDLREADTVAAFSIVEPPRASNDGFSIWTDGRTPTVLRVRNRLDDIGNWLFRTHPSTEKRCALLQSWS
ncbi:M48 family metalloprotease (plasmid) [Haladaptatus sp. SPP-AMP-3]|uniref:M48 family metalloprotease n=1 Tax=Haladaptatus sp. SPP-AMP-3 TaxID=3121295 RepID=UPI003C307E3A